jgi:predicted transcriptional regulator YdeE
MKRGKRLLAMLIMVLVASAVQAQPKPATKPAAGAPGDSMVGEMRVETLKGVTYLHMDTQVTLMTIGPTVEPAVTKLLKMLSDAHIAPAGPLMFVYHNATANPNKKFTLEIGFPVKEDVEAPAGLTKTKAEPFKCATMLYSGPVAKMGAADQQLYTDLFGEGLTPTGVMRDYYLYFEDKESANNVVLIQVGVQ